VEKTFNDALKNGDVQELRRFKKSDRHNHGFLGGCLDYFAREFGIYIERPPSIYQGIEELQAWVDNKFLPRFEGASGFEKTYEASFFTAKQDGVTSLEMNIDVMHTSRFNGSVGTLINVLERIHQHIAPDIQFVPEIGFNRHIDASILLEWFEPYLDYDYFQSIDLYATEFVQPIKNFKEIYKLAKEKGMKLKAHIGEFGSPESIVEAIEILDLDAVQHGIRAVESQDVMEYLKERQIPLHVCPTSNVRLGIIKDYSSHPIRTLFDYGIYVTINSDDIAAFDSSLSEEYLHLYEANLFSASELNRIRENGLNIDK
jgi:adenosine deaminase